MSAWSHLGRFRFSLLRVGGRLWFAMTILALALACGPPGPVREATGDLTREAAKLSTRFDRSFRLQPGEVLSAEVRQDGVDYMVSVVGPEGQTIVESDGLQGATGEERIVAVAERAGDYRLVVRRFDLAPITVRPEIRRIETRRSRASDRKRFLAYRAHTRAEAFRKGRSGGGSPSLSAALASYGQASALFEDLGDLRYAADAAFNAGRLLLRQPPGVEAESIRRFERAARLYARASESALEATSLHHLGSLSVSVGQLELADEYNLRALRLRRREGDRFGEAVSSGELAGVRYRRGDLDAARELWQRADEIFCDVGAERRRAKIQHNLGQLEGARSNFGEAAAHLKAALELARGRLSSPERATIRSHGALYLARDNRPEEAEDWISTAERLRRRDDLRGRSVTANHRGVISWLAGDPVAAEGSFLRAVTLARRAGASREEGRNLQWVGRMRMTSGDFAAAEQVLLQALGVLRRVDDPPGMVATLHQLGRLAIESGDRKTALERVEEAVGLLERLRRRGRRDYFSDASYLSDRQHIYDTWISLLAEEALEGRLPGGVSRLVAALEGARARALLDHLMPVGDSTDLPHSIRKIRSRLTADESLLVYRRAGGRFLALTLDEDQLRLEDLGESETVVQDALAAHRLLGENRRRSRARTNVLLDRLGQRLIEPVAGSLRRRVAVVADEPLDLVPYSALPAGGTASLGERHAIWRVPSASVLVELRQRDEHRERPPGGLVALGSQSEPRTERAAAISYLRLEHSWEELLVASEWGRRHLGAGQIVSATVSARLLARAQMIHFASHGRAAGLAAEEVRLIFGPVDDAESHILRAGEVAGWNLEADLVILAACETALGEPLRGEGRLGLSQAFLHAGASQVLFSLWAIDDRRTAELMAEFYRQLSADGDPVAALARARRLAAKDLEISDWAAFSILGSGRPIRGFGSSPDENLGEIAPRH